MRILARPDSGEVSFAPPAIQFAVKPVNLIADTLNNDSVDKSRTSKHTTSRYFIHVSDLMQVNSSRKFCPRQTVLSLVEKKGEANYRKLPPGMRLLHTIGHAVQNHITNDFIARSPHRDKVWGSWICRCGQRGVGFSFKPKPGADTCTKCGYDPDIYEEITITWPEYNLAGHPDLCIVWGNVLHIYEIKTIDRKGVDFNTMEAPLGDHTLQGSFYYWIMDNMQKKDAATLKQYPGAFSPSIPFEIDPYVNYVYADRSNENLFKRNFYKEFTKRASTRDRIEEMLRSAGLVSESLQKKQLPTRLAICKGPNSPRAKTCHCAISCFSRTTDKIHV